MAFLRSTVTTSPIIQLRPLQGRRHCVCLNILTLILAVVLGLVLTKPTHAGQSDVQSGRTARQRAPNIPQAVDRTHHNVGKSTKETEYVQGEVLVLVSADRNRNGIFEENEDLEGVESAVQGTVKRRISLSRGRHRRRNRGQKMLRVKLPPGKSVKDALSENWGKKDPRILSVEANYLVHTLQTANDPYFSEMWALRNTGQTGGTAGADIDVLEAWDLTTGSSSVIVAVIDSGIDCSHPDLLDNIWTNPGEIAGNGIDDDDNGYIDDVHGYDFFEGDGNPQDAAGHGTHCAGTIAACGNNNTGVTGVNWQCKLMACRFLDDSGAGSVADAVEAIDYAVSNGAKILNNSWGWTGFPSATLNAAIVNAKNHGVLFVAAAGNNGSDNDVTWHYPSNYEISNVIAVAATNHNDELAYFSNYGSETVHLGAPGVSILSTLPGNSYGFYSGTSMAAPHVSGVAALIWAYYPDMSLRDLKSQIVGTGDLTASLQGNTIYGRRLNAYNALISTPEPIQDYFTEQFSCSYPFDLSNKAIMFTPNGDGSSYSACLQEITRLPTDLVGSTTLDIDDDDFVSVSLADQEAISFYGSSFSSFYIGSNGYITFNQGDTEYYESLSNHFGKMRISVLFDDFNPEQSGTVSWKQMADRVAVTWQNIPEYNSGNANTFQVEMYFDGRIRLAWLEVEVQDGIVGLSEGLGIPLDFWETDLSEYTQCETELPCDDFDDNTTDSKWTIEEEIPKECWLNETNQRLELRARSGVNDAIAAYMSNGWQLDAASDFSFKVDFNYSPVTWENGWVFINMLADLSDSDDKYVNLLAGCDQNSPYFYCEAADGQWSVSYEAARAASTGTLYVSYNSANDDLYLSYTGYGSENAWKTISGLLQGRWDAESIYVGIGGGSENVGLNTGDAYLDDFTIETGTVISSFVRPRSIISIQKSTVRAGRCRRGEPSRGSLGFVGRDSMSIRGQFDATAGEIAGADKINVKIRSSENRLVYSTSIDFDYNNDVKRDKYRYRAREGETTISFSLDLNRNKFSFSARNIELTGLSCPLSLELEIGDYLGIGQADEEIVNGRRPIPMDFMVGYADKVRVDRYRVRLSSRASSDSLDVTGVIALEDPESANITDEQVLITWGSKTFIIPAGSFSARRNTNRYQCRQVAVSETGLMRASIDLDRCKLRITVKNAVNLPNSGTVNFGMEFGSFNEAVQVSIPE